MSCELDQKSFRLRLDNPVPGIDIDPRTPESRAFKVNCNGPSLIDLVNDLIPRSVILKPAIVLSKLIIDFLVIVVILRVSFS